VSGEDTELGAVGWLVREPFPDGPLVDGRPAVGAPARWRRRVQRLLASKGEREEAELERLLGQQPAVSRANVAAVISPRAGSARPPARS
jgi:hypothetical protein